MVDGSSSTRASGVRSPGASLPPIWPPAVPLGELLDVVDRTARFPHAATAREGVIVEHPLQPFDLRN